MIFYQFVTFLQFQYGFCVICCEYLLIDYSVVVAYPIFEYVLWCKVVDVNLKMIDFGIKVENKNDNGIISNNNFNTISYSFKNYISTFKGSEKECIIYIYYPLFLPNPGQLKLIRWAGNAINLIADSSTHQLKNLTLPNIQNPNKIKQNPKFHPSNHLSYPISSKSTKIKHFSHFNPKN